MANNSDQTLEETLADMANRMNDGDKSSRAMGMVAASLPMLLKGLSNRAEAEDELDKQVRALRKQVRKLQAGQRAILAGQQSLMEGMKLLTSILEQLIAEDDDILLDDDDDLDLIDEDDVLDVPLKRPKRRRTKKRID